MAIIRSMTIGHNLSAGLPGRAFIYAIKCFLFLRLLSSAILLFASLYSPPSVQPNDPDTLANLGEIETQSTISKLFLAPWYRWDTIHYINIAKQGYTDEVSTVWPPLYPLLTKIFSFLFAPPLLAGIIVSNLSAIAALLLLYLIVTDSWGEKTARETLIYITFFPTAFFLMAAYTESLFLALSLGCLYTYKKLHWGWAAVLGSAAVLTRLQGIVLIVPMLWTIIRAVIVQKERRFQWLAQASIPAGAMLLSLSGYFCYVHFGLNMEWPWVTLSKYWYQHMGWPWEGILGNLSSLTIRPLSTPISPIAQFYDLILICIAIGLICFTYQKFPTYYYLYAVFLILVILIKIDNLELLVSASRYLLMIFPVMIALAMTLKKTCQYIWYGISLGSQVIMLMMFYWWVWIA